MANNEHINKVVKSTGETLIDLTNDTVTAGTLLKDVTAHDRSGAQIVGEVIVAPTDVTQTEDNEAYLYKSSEHDAVYDELVGGSMAWNQLVANSGSSLSVTITSGHKYILKKSGTLSVGASSGSAITGLTGGTDWITDLTLMFGTTIADYVYNLEQSTAGSGIVWLKSYGFFTKDYYAYNAGSLVSVNTSGKKVVGKNLVKLQDKTITAAAYIFDITGLNLLSGTYTFSFNSIGNPNTSFAATYEDGTDAVNAPVQNHKLTFTADKRIVKIRFYGTTDTYSNMQLELGSTATDYEPYTSITYPIQSTDLRGLYKLNGNKLYTDGDIYSADGTVTRKYVIVALGTLEWTYDASHNRMYATNAAIKANNDSTIANAVCNKYTICTRDDLFTTDKAVSINYSGGTSWINVRDIAYTTEASFKAAMSGVYLICELATPTALTLTPYTSPQMVYRNGTEEYIDTRDVPMPVGGNRKYVDIPEWMVNQYFDDVRAEASNVSNIIEKLRRIDVTNGSSSTVRTIYAPDANNGIRTTVRNNRTEVQVACGQASNANGKVVFTDSEIYGGIGNPTSASANHFMFHNDCVGDSIGKLSSGSPLTGSEFDLNYETINLNGSTINIYDNMSIGFETIDDYTVNTIKSPYMAIATDGMSLSPKTTNQFDLFISRLPSGAGSELVVNSNGTVYQSSSSRDIKHDIQYIENTENYHDALMQIKPATYVYNNDKTETTKLGMIAEDIADVMPIAALTGEGGKVDNYDTRAIIAMLVMEVQRLNAEIERLRGDSSAN